MVPVPTPLSTYSAAEPKQTTKKELYSKQEASDHDVYTDDPDIQQNGQTQPTSDPEPKWNIPGSIHSINAMLGIENPQPTSSDTKLSVTGADAVTGSGSKISLDTLSNPIFGGTLVALSTAAPFVNPVMDSQAMTKNGEMVQLHPDEMPVAGSNLTPGVPPVPISRTAASVRPFSLTSGARSISPASQSPGILVTTIGGRLVTTRPMAVDVVSSTLTPGAPGMIVDGTLLSLNTASELIVGSRTISLGSKSADTDRVVVGSLVSGAPFASSSSTAPKGNSSTATGDGADPGIEPFEGNAESRKGSSVWSMIAVLTNLVLALVHVR